jgi:DNA end-binding protein Ku
LIDSLSDQQLDPDRYRDVHRETLTALIDAKASGRTVAAAEGEPAAPPLDLLNALRASIEAAKQRRSTGNGARRRPAPSAAATTAAAKKRQKKPTEKPAEPVRGAPKKRG